MRKRNFVQLNNYFVTYVSNSNVVFVFACVTVWGLGCVTNRSCVAEHSTLGSVWNASSAHVQVASYC